MTDDADTPEGLTPARPDAADEAKGRPAYMPRLPWLWILLTAALVGTLIFSYAYRQQQRAEELRTQLLGAHREQLGELVARYMGFRERIEDLILDAASAGEPEPWADPRLDISGLRGGDGVYFRLRADEAQDRESIILAALQMEPDAIPRCLGLAPVSVAGVYRRGDFLTPQWVDEVRTAPDLNRLRVKEDLLRRHVRVDVPVVGTLINANWLLAIIEQGDSRATSPVDVYLWDLRRNRQLLKARIQGRGVLLPVRVALPGVPGGRAPATQNVESIGATDCSIASQIRGLTGETTLSVTEVDGLVEENRATLEAEAEAAAEEAARQEAARQEAAAEGEAAEGEAAEGEAAEGEAAEEAGERETAEAPEEDAPAGDDASDVSEQ